MAACVGRQENAAGPSALLDAAPVTAHDVSRSEGGGVGPRLHPGHVPVSGWSRRVGNIPPAEVALRESPGTAILRLVCVQTHFVR